MDGLVNKILVINAGVNGHNTADLLARLDRDVLAKKPQVVMLMVGTNDMLNLANILSVEDYETNYRNLIVLIQKQAKLFMMTIPPVNVEYMLARVGDKAYGKMGAKGKVDAANAVIRKLAAEYRCHLIDINKILLGCGGSTEDEDSLFMNEANTGIIDGVHPTVNGYRVIGTAVFQAINLIEPKATNIVCFGDSITYGYQVQGEGTIEGNPYPAVLNRLLNTR